MLLWRRTSQAFTLIELLVVVAIIALLVTILVPELTAARSLARMAVCQHNLHEIGQAFNARANAEMLGEAPPFRVPGWPRALLPYVANQTEVLTCPESGEFTAMPVEEMLEVRMYGGSFDYRLRLDGPFVAKMSNTQYQAVVAAGWMHHGKVLADCPAYTEYVPDGDDSVVWFCIEEITPESEGQEGLQSGAAAQDHEDIRMRVTDNEDGTFTLRVQTGSLGLAGDISNAQTGEVLVQSITQWRLDTNYGPFEGAFSECSYGMNAATRILGGAPGKILALDYERSVARSSDNWSAAKLDPDGDGVPSFARHGGRINVLFADGGVKKMHPQQINPASPSTAQTYWENPVGP